ncbi:MAG: class I SAM-dependent methyltransferase [Candidatus Woesearchaeota archaeon]
MKNFNYEKYYRHYWKTEFEKRRCERYYETLYDPIKKDLIVPNSKKIIDVGGGNGQFMNYLGYKNAVIFDISQSGLSFAKDNFGYSIVKGDILRRFPFSKEKFDVAYCFEVLEHLDKPNKTLSEIHSVLKKNGILFISILNIKPDGVHHKRRWKFNELKTDLEKSGFTIVWSKNIPRFNLSYKKILSGNQSLVQKLILLFGHTILFKKLRYFLANKFPDIFATMYILKCKKG